MKRSISQCLAVAMLTAAANFNALAGASPGEVDFTNIAEPGKNAEYVCIHIGHNLTSLASRLVEKRQPEAAKLLRSVQLIHLNVVGLTDENRDVLQKRVHEFRDQLDKQGWARVVTVKEKDGDDVGVFVKTRGDEAVEGVVVTVLNGKEKVVLINVVGDIKPEQIAALGEALNIDPLKEAGALVRK